MNQPIAVGDILHGFCGGVFGRDHYTCCTVEALGPDWLVARNPRGELSWADGEDALVTLRRYRERTANYDGDFCCEPRPAWQQFPYGPPTHRH
ncbi:hypothetical protein ACGFZP_12950 [Kitasatospora sp. NPDC048239]|uniref:hypothetical protein n=1 Tax=Kitasatospora sp. NPDC048239 TaxID=3364046 RepID=UPI00371D8AF1